MDVKRIQSQKYELPKVRKLHKQVLFFSFLLTGSFIGILFTK